MIMSQKRKMRRNAQQLDDAECRRILDDATSGVLSLIDADGEPYGVPLSYGVAEGKIYFHCAVAGRKLDAVRSHGRASFCIIERDDVLPAKFTTAYRSVIAEGRIAEITDEDERLYALRLLAAKYSPEETAEAVEQEICGCLNRVTVLALTIENLSGKQGKELMKQNRGD